MFIDNKYTRWYLSIVSRRRAQPPEGYTERHHVIPTCLGGSNDKENLVRLTAREHFICHLLLMKMVEPGPGRSKLANALFRMINSKDSTKRYAPSSRIYEFARQAHAKSVSECHRGRVNSPEHRAQISAALRGRTQSESHLAALSAARKGVKKSLETRVKMSEAHKKRWAKRKAAMETQHA